MIDFLAEPDFAFFAAFAMSVDLIWTNCNSEDKKQGFNNHKAIIPEY